MGGPQKDPKWRVLWLRTDGTVWNKGRTSQGTSKAMQWSHFTGQEWPSGDLEPQNSLLWSLMAIWDPLGALWHIWMAFPYPRNCSNASPGICPDLFHPCSTLFHQLGATRSAYDPKRTFLAVLDALGAFWRTQMALPDPKNCSNSSLGMCPDLFHPCSTLFDQFGVTRSAYGLKRLFLAVLDSFGGPLAHPDGPP